MCGGLISSIVTHKTLYLIGLIDLDLAHQAVINLLIRQKKRSRAFRYRIVAAMLAEQPYPDLLS